MLAAERSERRLRADMFADLTSHPISSGPEPTVVRCFDDARDDWRAVVTALGPVLAREYPGGDQWLARRLDDVADGTAHAHLVDRDAEVIGVAIESPKGETGVKLSTLWVKPHFRGHGIGRTLVRTCTDRWSKNRVSRGWITANAHAVADVGRLVLDEGFSYTCLERDRYGTGRHEWIFHWDPMPATRRAVLGAKAAPSGS